MLPDGVGYLSSWVDVAGTSCFQLMEASDASLLDDWIKEWNDLAAFEVIPVVSSADFWSARERPTNH
jgi:Protein of unknown function (DUF3303)